MPSYSGPIYFEAVPYACGSPSTQASSSRPQTCVADTHAASVSSALAVAREGDIEWTRVDALPTRRSTGDRHLNHASRLSGAGQEQLIKVAVQRPFTPESRSFDFLPPSGHTRALAYRSDDENPEMKPASYSWNSRSGSLRRPGKIRERSEPCRVAIHGTDTSLSASQKPFSTPPSRRRVGDSARNSTWTRALGVGAGQHPLLEYHSVSLRPDSLQIPYDVDMDRDLNSPRTLPSSLHTHPSTVEMSTPGSSRSSLGSDRRFSPIEFTSSTYDRVSDGCSNSWHDEAPSFLAFSPCPSSCSSTMGFASTLPREPVAFHEPTYRSLLDRWQDSEEWKEEVDREGEGSISSSEGHCYNINAYPRSATSSPHFSDTDMHPAVLPALLDQQDFSTLMLQSFRLALADAAEEQSDGFELFKEVAEAGNEATSVMSFPTHVQDFDFFDEWSPPALRPSSSASSLDPFHLELFSPAAEQTDPAAVWEANVTSGDSSGSRNYLSTSPFMGWSSSSDAETKPALLTLGRMPFVSRTELPLHQPQPIRPVRPIDIAANLIAEFPERNS